MSSTAAPAHHGVGGRLRLRRLLTIAAIVLGVGLVADLLGWDLSSWFSQLWDTLTAISPASLVAACVLQTFQTLFVAEGWLWILRYGYPEARISRKSIIACYAASVAMNNVLPANLGTLAMLIMFTAIIAGATFAGVLGGYVVQKIFWTAIGAATYLYLFLSVPGSFDIELSWLHEHPLGTVLIVVGGGALIAIVVRILWAKVKKLWQQAKQGGRILASPRAYFVRVVLPNFLSWLCKLGVIAVFLGAYGIPVSFHTVMQVQGGNSIANVTSVTPGGVGVTQAVNVATLNGVASTADATAYSVGQQLFTTAWNILFGIVMVVWAFGWTGGKALVKTSYEDAKEKAAEEQAKRKARKSAQAQGG